MQTPPSDKPVILADTANAHANIDKPAVPVLDLTPKKTWGEALAAYLDKRVLTMFFLGFSSGLPYLLIFSSLSIWLQEAGFNIKVITMFSWAMLGYSFKFVWAPLIDAVPLPFLTKALGRRRGWLLVAQLLIATAIVLLGSVPPTSPDVLGYMAGFAVLLGFASASQDIVIDAYRIEIAEPSLQSALAAMFIGGYRIGLIVAGAGALVLAEYLGSTAGHYRYEAWRNTYYIMASLGSIGIITTLLMREPVQTILRHDRATHEYLHLFALFLVGVAAFIGTYLVVGSLLPAPASIKSPLLVFGLECVHLLSAIVAATLTGMVLVKTHVVNKAVATQVWVAPLQDFFVRYGKKALWLLLLISLYRISDIVAGTTSNLFYTNLGFSKTDIAKAVKTVGMIMSIFGGFIGGVLSERYRIMQAMMLGTILSSTSLLLFVWLALRGHDFTVMYTAVVLDNLASGLASAVFVAFLASLTNIRFTAVQYAILSSLMTLIPKTLGGYSGSIVASLGYPAFYAFTAMLGIPIMVLVYIVDKKVMINPSEKIE